MNSIAESSKMRVDIRSTSTMEIERLEMELRRAVEHAVAEENGRWQRSNSGRRHEALRTEIHAIGNRPAGELDRRSRILQIARAVDTHLGNAAQIQRASTDANIPISLGREAIAIGGGGAHTLQEWFDITGRELALSRILLIALALAGCRSPGQRQ